MNGDDINQDAPITQGNAGQFADLLGQAAAIEQAEVAAPGAAALPGQLPAPIDYRAEATDLVEFLHALCEPPWPTLGKIYTPDKRERIAAALAPVLEKYNFNLGMLGPELAFAVTVLPFVGPTVEAIRHDNAEAKKKATQGSGASEQRTDATQPGAGAPGDIVTALKPGTKGAPVELYKRA